MSTTPNTQATISASNLAVSAEQARLDAKRGTSRTKVASTKAQPAAQPHVELPATATGDAMLQALMAKMAQQDALIAQLLAEKQSGKPAEKPAKQPTIITKNCTYTYDSGKLVVTFDLNADIIDPTTNAPKVSKSGETTGVACFQGSFIDKNGRKVGVGCNAYHKIGK